jgi:DNA (cytosine-5)-methyltransferase 1
MIVDAPKVLDLFCGAGGMSEGLVAAGFNVVAGIDSDLDSTQTFRYNHSDETIVLHEDLRSLTPKQFEERTGIREIEMIVGGPPCQGFSIASVNPKAKPNYGPNGQFDPRNELYRRFFDYVDHYSPTTFIMENVRGLRWKANGHYLESVKTLGSELGYGVFLWELLASDYGVPQMRRRLFVIGINNREALQAPKASHFPIGSLLTPSYVSTGEAILDLPVLTDNDGKDEMDYDLEVIKAFEKNDRFNPEFTRWARKGSNKLRHHISRYHSERDLRIFQMLDAGESSANFSPEQQAVIPYSMKSFRDKYRRQPIHTPSTTITAHLAKDGLYYIHPTQTRSLTPREAGRLQSFRDTYIFSGSRSSIYKQIGNAVPPLLAEAIARSLRSYH